jgi:predicted dehydrogenase
MNQPLRIVVVGCGIGRSHTGAWKKLEGQAEVVALCDLDKARAEALATEFNVPAVIPSLEEVLRRDDVDVVDICTPPYLHFEQISAALQAGKHAVCEKPLVSSLAKADALAEIEKTSGKRLMPIFQYRFGHGLQKLKLLIGKGLAGDAFLGTAETAWRRRADYYKVPWRGKWKTELGGAVLGIAIHNHDIVSYVLGPVKSVFARTATRVNVVEVEDCAAASLEMKNGALVTLSVTLGSPEEISRHRFCFRNLVAESGTVPYCNSVDPWKFTGDTPEIQKEIDNAISQFVPQPEEFIGQFSRFATALATGTELPVTLADARNSLELVTAIYSSAEEGRPVDLPITSSHSRYQSWIPAANPLDNPGASPDH